MREIKFRFWGRFGEWDDEADEPKFEMMSGDDFAFNDGDAPINDLFAFNSSKTVCMQYTGLRDKNGKEIYEGDINADDKNEISVITFYAGGFYLKYSILNYRHIGGFATYNLNIIGNIYENPEPITTNEEGK